MILYTETHAHTLRHRLAHSHALARTRTHTHMCHTIAAHTLQSGTVCFFYSMLAIHTQPFTNLYKHTIQIGVRANAHALPLELSLSHTHTLTHSQSHMSILWTSLLQTSPYTFSSGRFLADKTMRNDSKRKCTTCSPIRPLSSKPNICVFLSVCTRLVLRSAEKGKKKRLRPRKKMSGNDSNPRAWFRKATVTERRSLYCIYMV